MMSDSTSSATTPPAKPVGVEAALKASPNDVALPTLFSQDFSLANRVALVTGGCGGLGLEAALAFIEAGARAVYCVDLAKEPTGKWQKVQEYASRLSGKAGEGRLEYVSADVTDQQRMVQVATEIGDKEGRLDVCVVGHGIGQLPASCLDYPADVFKKAIDVNMMGVLYTAQAAGKQMVRFGNGGSIILVASVAGSVAFRDAPIFAYNTSKAAVIQMARSMACELGAQKIRVNSLSPGFIYTPMTSQYIDQYPGVWASQNPLGRTGLPHEIRGVATWLASDASTFCTGSDIVVDGGHRAW